VASAPSAAAAGGLEPVGFGSLFEIAIQIRCTVGGLENGYFD